MPMRRSPSLSVFAAQLRAAADQLAGEPIDGPCGDDSACLRTPDTDTLPMALGRQPPEAPIACTLGAGEVPDRLAAWDRIMASATTPGLRLPSGGVRLEFESGVDIGELGRLVVAEQACCAFFQFAVTVDGRGVGLEVDAPAAACGSGHRPVRDAVERRARRRRGGVSAAEVVILAAAC